MQLGLENTGGKLDYREQVEYAAEYDTTTASGSSHSWPVYERLKGKNPWPDKFQPTLQPTTKIFSPKVCQVADILRDSLCLALHLDPKDELQVKFVHETEVPLWLLKLISYPVEEMDSAEKRQRQGVGHTPIPTS